MDRPCDKLDLLINFIIRIIPFIENGFVAHALVNPKHSKLMLKNIHGSFETNNLYTHVLNKQLVNKQLRAEILFKFLVE